MMTRHLWAGLALAALIATPALLPAEDAAPAADAAAPAADTTGKVELQVKLPKPLFIGTPKDIRSANLEKTTGKKRPPILVPEGLTNLAEGKDVTSSDKEPIVGDLTLLTDVDKEGTDGSFVELGPGVQWMQVDMGETAEIWAILLWHYHAQARVYKDVVVRVADDPDFIKNVRTIYNNDHDNSAGLGVGQDKEYIENYEGRYIDAKGVKARYVRFYSNGSTANDQNHYIEAEIYGKAAQ